MLAQSPVWLPVISDKLRNKIDRCMKDFGTRMQFSIFLCRLDANDVARCRAKLLAILDKHKKLQTPNDSLIIFERIQPDKAECLLGKRIEREAPTFLVV